MQLRTAKIAGAIAWYLECPKCEGTVIDEDGGSVTHGFHTTGENLICMECGIELKNPKLPKRIPIA